MTATLPANVQSVFDRFITTEYTTIDAHGQPITWPVTPYYELGDPVVSVTTGLGYPKKADDAARNSLVSLLFSDPNGSDLSDAPMVLVQGCADVDDRDLEHNRERYVRESKAKLPGVQKRMPPAFMQRFLTWYYTRIYVHVRPERIYVWEHGDATTEPTLYDAHMEEVRSGHSEEPDRELAEPEGGDVAWDPRLDELGTRYPTAVLSFVAPDGFPFSARVPVSVDREAGRVRVGPGALGLPIHSGLACLAAHEHAPDFSWQLNFQVRGDLVADADSDDSWSLIPHRLIGGLELPPSQLQALRDNFARSRRFAKVAKRELAKRTGAKA